VMMVESKVTDEAGKAYFNDRLTCVENCTGVCVRMQMSLLPVLLSLRSRWAILYH
jgi:hypothetical protein